MNEDLTNKLKNCKDFKWDTLFNGGYNKEPMNKGFTVKEEQEIKEAFDQWRDINIHAEVTPLVDYIIQQSMEDNDTPLSYEDMTNPYDLETYKDELLRQYKEELKEKYEDDKDEETFEEWFKDLDDSELQDIGQEIGLELEDFRNEPMEWYIVSYGLAKALDNEGEVTLNNYIWGRCGTGQAVKMDYVMQKLFLQSIGVEL